MQKRTFAEADLSAEADLTYGNRGQDDPVGRALRLCLSSILVKFMKALPRPASDDILPELRNPPAYIVAEGDLVTFIFKQSSPDPKDKTKSYERFTFDMFRVKNGKIVEHWDGAAR